MLFPKLFSEQKQDFQDFFLTKVLFALQLERSSSYDQPKPRSTLVEKRGGVAHSLSCTVHENKRFLF